MRTSKKISGSTCNGKRRDKRNGKWKAKPENSIFSICMRNTSGNNNNKKKAHNVVEFNLAPTNLNLSHADHFLAHGNLIMITLSNDFIIIKLCLLWPDLQGPGYFDHSLIAKG